jgi:hypothetical protein
MNDFYSVLIVTIYWLSVKILRELLSLNWAALGDRASVQADGSVTIGGTCVKISRQCNLVRSIASDLGDAKPIPVDAKIP